MADKTKMATKSKMMAKKKWRLRKIAVRKNIGGLTSYQALKA